MSSFGQRAFAQKLNKQAAADVRRQVSSAVSQTDLRKSTSGANLSSISSAHTLSWDVVQPPDYEEFLFQHEALLDRDPYRHLLYFPLRDITVDVLPRTCRTLLPISPQPGSVTSSHVNDCVKSYTSDYTVVTRRYQRYSSTQERATPRDCLPQQEYRVDYEDARVDDDEGEKRVSSQMSDTPRGSWASSIIDLKNSQADPLLPTLLDRIPPREVDAANESYRRHNRHHSLFSLYPASPEEEFVERRLQPEPPRDYPCQRIHVTCLKFKLALNIEPIFASMALYDARERKKISENFYFDLNSDSQLRMLNCHVPEWDMSTLSRQCVFNITYPSNDVCLVIRLEKVLQQGDLNDVAEPYMKEDTLKEDKYRANAEDFCKRLGKYRMPFAWTYIDLTNRLGLGKTQAADPGPMYPEPENTRAASLDRRTAFHNAQGEKKRSRDDVTMRRGSVERGRSGYEKRRSWSSDEQPLGFNNFQPVTLDITFFMKQEPDKLSDEELGKILSDVSRPTSAHKKFKSIPGSLSLHIAPYTDDIKYLLTPELYQVHPYPDDKERPVKEVLEFPQRHVYTPYTSYRNLLFVYPKLLTFTSRQGSARNIACKVQFMCGEDESQALPVIFGKSSCREFSTEQYTTVTYHSKSPSFYEEVKVRMPAELTEAHHLLFTFYHISCQKKVDMGPTEMPIGYTWLPLIHNNRLVTGEFMLPVSLDKPPIRYSILHPDASHHGMKWADNHKGVFSVTLNAVSSIHTQDEHLDKFLSFTQITEHPKNRLSEPGYESDLKRSMLDVYNSQPEPLIHFLPLILNKFILFIIRPPVINGNIMNIGQTAFEALGQTVRRVHHLLYDNNDQHGRNSLLVTYVQYLSCLPHPSTLHTVVTTPNLGGQYATLGRPTSLPVAKQNIQRSTSDPDLMGSNPNSPDCEVAMFTGKAYEKGATLGREAKNLITQKIRGKKLVHEELALQWVVSSGPTREIALENAWFLFDIIIKSMAETLSHQDKMDSPRNNRFPDYFMDDIAELINKIITEIVERFHSEPNLVASLNTSLAFFLHDLFSLINRGFVFQLIKNYCTKIASMIYTLADPTSVVVLRLDFLRIICSHEHYFALNLPFGPTISPSAPSSPTPSVSSSASVTSYTTTSTLTDKGIYTELTLSFRQQHFLVGIVLNDLTMSLSTHNQTLIHKAINVIRNLLSSHDLDPRYAQPEIKSRIAALYLPLIGIITDSLPLMYNPVLETAHKGTLQDECDRINQKVAMAIAGSNVYNKSHDGAGQESKEYHGKSKRFTMSLESTRHLLACFLWVVKNADGGVLRHWWAELSPPRIGQLLDVLHLSVSNFEYKAKWAEPKVTLVSNLSCPSLDTLDDWQEGARGKGLITKSSSENLWEGLHRRSVDLLRGTGSLLARGPRDETPTPQGRKVLTQCSQQTLKKSVDMKSRLEDAILGMGSARSEMMRRKQVPCPSDDKTPPSPMADTRLRWRKDQFWKQPPEQHEQDVPRTMMDVQIEGKLAAEVSLVILDILELIIQIIQNSELSQILLTSALRVLLHGLGLNQSTVVLQNMFSTQRSLVSKFPELLFEEETEQCADLCLRLLRHCSSSVTNTRSHASASLYLLMRQNFEMGNNFARVKMQVTMSLSSLVGQNHNFQEQFLRKSLKTILTYAEADVELQETTFPEQVQDMVFNLHMILSDTVKMKEFQDDPEMLIDLMYRIAKGYQNSPDLRLTWLENMANKHMERGNRAEAAQCIVHAAGLVSEYLNMLEDRSYMPVGCVAFVKVSKNVLEESAVSDDVVTPDGEGICTGKYVTEGGLVGLLEQAAKLFTEAGMYEAVNEVYKVLIPIHEANYDFARLAQIHSKLHDAFTNIVRQEGKRMFGTYFRIGFYGSKFGDLDGEEFVYKEPAITKLSEISGRLENLYGERYGRDNFAFIKDSNNVEREKLNPDKVYIQVTYVEPYFDLYEFRERVTHFQKNYNIKRFMYATPFTSEGRAHGELSDQYKRKTVLTTRHTFPYVKTRLSVVNREQMILSPIEVAIEDIQKRTRELWLAYSQEPTDTKILQMVLQGCIGTTVNQGPVEVALVFLQDVAQGQEQPTKHHNKLRLSFKDFMKKCSDALQKNKSLITSDMKEYQRELERNYKSMTDKLKPLITSNASQQQQLRRARHHKKDREERAKNRADSTDC